MSDQRITMFRSEGSYDWAHPQNKQAQIAIAFPLNGKIEKLSACVEIGEDFDIPVDQDTCPEVGMVDGFTTRKIEKDGHPRNGKTGWCNKCDGVGH